MSKEEGKPKHRRTKEQKSEQDSNVDQAPKNPKTSENEPKNPTTSENEPKRERRKREEPKPIQENLNQEFSKKEKNSPQTNNPPPKKDDEFGEEVDPEDIKPKKLSSKFNFLDHSKYSATVEDTTANSKNIIFIGSKNSGKTSLINSLLSIDPSIIGSTDSYGPTNGINYNYIKLANKKKIINLFEIGGGFESINLLREILTPSNITSSWIFIVLDFGKPKECLQTLVAFLHEINNYIQILQTKNKDDIAQLSMKKLEKLPGKQTDRNMEIIPLEITILGNKYDILERLNAEEIKWTCRTLRFFAFKNGINLMYTSIKQQKLIKNLHDNIVNFSTLTDDSLKFKSDQYLDKNDINPIYVNFYNDSIADIGDPKVMRGGKGDLEGLWEETYNTLFKTFKEENEASSNEIAFSESFWDEYKENKLDNEVALFQKNREKRAKKNI